MAAAGVITIDIPSAVEEFPHVGTILAVVEGQHGPLAQTDLRADAEDVGDLHVMKAMRVPCSLTKGIELPRFDADGVAELAAHLDVGGPVHGRDHVLLEKVTGYSKRNGSSRHRNCIIILSPTRKKPKITPLNA